MKYDWKKVDRALISYKSTSSSLMYVHLESSGEKRWMWGC